MSVLIQGVIFLASCAVLWLASSLVVSRVEALSKQAHISTFATSTLILGILTSLTEVSVGLNSIIEGVPSVYAGNLIGSAFVILVLIIPLLAIMNNGITIRDHIDQRRLLFFIILLLAPSLMIIDGRVSVYDAVILVLLYGLFMYYFHKAQSVWTELDKKELPDRNLFKNIAAICIGAGLIYLAGNLLVGSVVFFADLLQVPRLVVSILVLSIGTNVPELAVAINSIVKHHAEIAFGNYVGSAALNSLIFGVLTLMNGSFSLETQGFSMGFWIIVGGYTLFFLFARSKNHLSRVEGMLLLLVYVVFVVFELQQIAILSDKV